MHFILFTHPGLTASKSMNLYARMIQKGMESRGHEVTMLTAKPLFSRVPVKGLRKWLGYIDQFIVFPIYFKFKQSTLPANSLYVFTDHALGPWVPLVKRKPHVVHCHDFIAQKSALAEMNENKLSRTGIWYQRFIRKGYSKATNFISISQATQADLHRFLPEQPHISQVVYNGLNQDFNPGNTAEVRSKLTMKCQADLTQGYIFHIGSNAFYKNRSGVLAIYTAWRKESALNLPLVLVGQEPDEELQNLRKQSPFAEDIHFITGVADKDLHLFYQGASVLLFPSLEEGFGWPIAEAQACGCPVITTDRAPMTEVGGEAAFYIPRLDQDLDTAVWAIGAAQVVEEVTNLDAAGLQSLQGAGLENAKRFNTETSLDTIERIYKQIQEHHAPKI